MNFHLAVRRGKKELPSQKQKGLNEAFGDIRPVSLVASEKSRKSQHEDTPRKGMRLLGVFI